MTAAAEVLDELRARGVRVRADGDNLRCSPREVLDGDPELRARVVAAKPGLLCLLAPEPVSLDDGLAVREVLAFPARLLGGLPLATTLALEVPGVADTVTVATHARAERATFDAAEWLALVDLAERGRARPADLVAWCGRKRRATDWRLTAPADAGDAPVVTLWTVGRVLEHLGACLRLVAIEGGANGETAA